MEALCPCVHSGYRPTLGVELQRIGRREFRKLLLVHFALMQQPEFEAISFAAADAGCVDAACFDLETGVVVVGLPGDGVNADPWVPDMGAHGRIESAATPHTLTASAIGQHDVIDGQPSDRGDVDHCLPPSPSTSARIDRVAAEAM